MDESGKYLFFVTGDDGEIAMWQNQGDSKLTLSVGFGQASESILLDVDGALNVAEALLRWAKGAANG